MKILKMRKTWERFAYVTGLAVILIFFLNTRAFAVTWEFGTSGEGKNPFTPRGYVIVTDTGTYWLNSRFDNSKGQVTYTGVENGIGYFDAKKMDGSNYTLYAFTDRNPHVYQYLIAFKNGEPIPNFSSYAKTPGRLSAGDDLGSGAGWAIPIQGFEFEPGCYYEFAFQRGMQANNGISLVFSADGKGYIQYIETAEEKEKYEKDKNKEFEFISSYRVEKDPGAADYKYDFHLVPMRFSVQTFADLTTWEKGKQEAVEFIENTTPKDIGSGKYKGENIDDLKRTLLSLEQEAETSIKKQLQPQAEDKMQLMLLELKTALEKAKFSGAAGTNLEKLHALLEEANMLYQTASSNLGTGTGQYGKTETQTLKKRIDSASALSEKDSQEIINEAIRDLEEAMTRVHASVGREENIILFDRASGIKAVIPRGIVPDDVVMYVQRFSKSDATYITLQKTFGEEAPLAVYRIELYSHDLKIQPTGRLELQVPIPNGTAIGAFHVYTVGEKLATSQIQAAEVDEYKLFSVSQTGLFAIASAAQPPSPPENTGNEPVVAKPAQNSPTQTETRATVEETEVDIKEEPDTNREELDVTKGPKEAVDNEEDKMPRAEQEPLDPVSIPLDTVKKEAGSPIYVIILAVLLVATAAGIAVYSIVKRPKK